MNSVYMVWKEDADMLAIFASEGEAVALAEKRRQESEDKVRRSSPNLTFFGQPLRAERFSVERYDLPFTEGDVTGEIWPVG